MPKNQPLEDFPELAHALNEESWLWLSDQAPMLAAALEKEVKRGGKPENIRRFVMRHTQRDALARRIEQAAEYLKKQ